MASAWQKFEAQTWKHAFSQFDGLEITFREVASAASLLKMMRGGVMDAESDEKAAAAIVCKSILEPALSEAEFYALSTGHKLVLLTHVIEHAAQRVDKDFQVTPGTTGATAKPTPASETPTGSLGGRPSVSATVIPSV